VSAPWDGPVARLRRRRSAKWTTFDEDVLPLPVAEMDVTLAAPIAAVLHEAVAASDTGYAGDAAPLRAAFAGFAARRWGWRPEPSGIRTCADVAVGVTEVLRCLVRPGADVVLMPPVYAPFWRWLDAVGARPVEVPLREPGSGGRLDLPGIEAALAAGARAVLLCHPHNPTGRVHDVAELQALAALAARYGATVLADEIHAPLTLPGHTFRPYLTVSEAAAATGIAFHSASKAWNLAGLKCALVVAPAGRRDVPAGLADGMAWGVGHLGVLAATAAYDEGDAWLDSLREALAGNVALLADLLAEHLPPVAFHPPQAGFLAWLDCRGLDLGPDPASILLQRARVALSPGPDFGSPGHGFARLNLACHPDLLRDAVTRIAAVCRSG
jgi:cystathionine beta-lyase